MARLIKGKTWLDVYGYETSEDGTIRIDNEEKKTNNKKHDGIFPLKKCMLGGVVLTCPRNPLKFLEIAHGKDVLKPNKKCVNSKWIRV